jgi:hypothetical protein
MQVLKTSEKTKTLQDANQRKCQTCDLQKAKSKRMCAKDGMRNNSDSVSQGTRCKSCTDSRLLQTRDVSTMHDSTVLTAKECSQARQKCSED